jgi:hypothetical protein
VGPGSAEGCELRFPQYRLPPDVLLLSETATVSSLCEDDDVVAYFLENNIVMHSCAETSAAIRQKADCGAGAGAGGGGGGGADSLAGHRSANILDIVHHLYGGDSTPVLAAPASEGGYRVLFAGSFHPRDVYLFLRQLEVLEHNERFSFANYSRPSGAHKVQVCVLADDAAVAEQVSAYLSSCPFRQRPTNVQIVTRSFILSPGRDRKFDFIDYANDISTNEHYSVMLTKFRDLLTPQGVLSITAYSENAIVNKIRKYLFRSDRAAHAPFSADAIKFVSDFLVSEGLVELASDADLLDYIATVPAHMGGSTWQKSWSVADLSTVLSRNGLTRVAVTPAFVSSAYGNKLK